MVLIQSLRYVDSRYLECMFYFMT